MLSNLLTYNNEVIGFRFYTDEGVFDLERESALRLGFDTRKAKDSLDLLPSGDLLLTQEELDGGITVVDITGDREKQESLSVVAFRSGVYQTAIPWGTGVEVSGGEIQGTTIRYDKGVALFGISVHEQSGEFFVIDRKLLAYIAIENIEALKKVSDLSDGSLPLQWALTEFENGKCVFKLSLTQEQLAGVQKEFGCPLSFVRGGLGFSYRNSFTGMAYAVTINAPDFTLDKTFLKGNEIVGGSLYNISLESYFAELKQLYLNKQINYYPHINLNMINSI